MEEEGGVSGTEPVRVVLRLQQLPLESNGWRATLQGRRPWPMHGTDAFDHVCGTDATPGEIFDATVVPLVHAALAGCDAMLLALGAGAAAASSSCEVFGDCNAVKKEESVHRSGADSQKVARQPDSLRITISGATDLRNADWLPEQATCDPYCICEILNKPKAEKIRTKVVNNSTNPVWDHDAELPSYTAGDTLVFRVYNKDDLKRDDFLGTMTLDSDCFYPSGFEGEVPLLEAGKGVSAHLKLKIWPSHAQRLAELRCEEAAWAALEQQECCLVNLAARNIFQELSCRLNGSGREPLRAAVVRVAALEMPGAVFFATAEDGIPEEEVDGRSMPFDLLAGVPASFAPSSMDPLDCALMVEVPQPEDLMEQLHLARKRLAFRSRERCGRPGQQRRCLFSISVEQVVETGTGPPLVAAGRLTFLDLNGNDQTSLSSSLGDVVQVVQALALQQMNEQIPYEISTTTRQLRQALGGNCRTAMLLTASSLPPAEIVLPESTHQFALCVARILNRPQPTIRALEPLNLDLSNCSELAPAPEPAAEPTPVSRLSSSSFLQGYQDDAQIDHEAFAEVLQACDRWDRRHRMQASLDSEAACRVQDTNGLLRPMPASTASVVPKENPEDIVTSAKGGSISAAWSAKVQPPVQTARSASLAAENMPPDVAEALRRFTFTQQQGGSIAEDAIPASVAEVLRSAYALASSRRMSAGTTKKQEAVSPCDVEESKPTVWHQEWRHEASRATAEPGCVSEEAHAKHAELQHHTREPQVAQEDREALVQHSVEEQRMLHRAQLAEAARAAEERAWLVAEAEVKQGLLEQQMGELQAVIEDHEVAARSWDQEERPLREERLAAVVRAAEERALEAREANFELHRREALGIEAERKALAQMKIEEEQCLQEVMQPSGIVETPSHARGPVAAGYTTPSRSSQPALMQRQRSRSPDGARGSERHSAPPSACIRRRSRSPSGTRSMLAPHGESAVSQLFSQQVATGGRHSGSGPLSSVASSVAQSMTAGAPCVAPRLESPEQPPSLASSEAFPAGAVDALASRLQEATQQASRWAEEAEVLGAKAQRQEASIAALERLLGAILARQPELLEDLGGAAGGDVEALRILSQGSRFKESAVQQLSTVAGLPVCGKECEPAADNSSRSTVASTTNMANHAVGPAVRPLQPKDGPAAALSAAFAARQGHELHGGRETTAREEDLGERVSRFGSGNGCAGQPIVPRLPCIGVRFDSSAGVGATPEAFWRSTEGEQSWPGNINCSGRHTAASPSTPPSPRRVRLGGCTAASNNGPVSTTSLSGLSGSTLPPASAPQPPLTGRSGQPGLLLSSLTADMSKMDAPSALGRSRSAPNGVWRRAPARGAAVSMDTDTLRTRTPSPQPSSCEEGTTRQPLDMLIAPVAQQLGGGWWIERTPPPESDIRTRTPSPRPPAVEPLQMTVQPIMAFRGQGPQLAHSASPRGIEPIAIQRHMIFGSAAAPTAPVMATGQFPMRDQGFVTPPRTAAAATAAAAATSLAARAVAGMQDPQGRHTATSGGLGERRSLSLRAPAVTRETEGTEALASTQNVGKSSRPARRPTSRPASMLAPAAPQGVIGFPRCLTHGTVPSAGGSTPRALFPQVAWQNGPACGAATTQFGRVAVPPASLPSTGASSGVMMPLPPPAAGAPTLPPPMLRTTVQSQTHRIRERTPGATHFVRDHTPPARTVFNSGNAQGFPRSQPGPIARLPTSHPAPAAHCLWKGPSMHDGQ